MRSALLILAGFPAVMNLTASSLKDMVKKLIMKNADKAKIIYVHA